MKSSLFLFAGALSILSACNVEIQMPEEKQESGEKKMVTEKVSVKSENDGNETKVAIDGTNTYQWTSNDYLAFFVTNDGGTTYEKKMTASPINTETKEFTLSYEEGYTRGGYGVIPASFAKSLADGKLTVTYPDSYDISADIKAGRYDNRGTYIPVPMVAVNSGSNMTFYSIGALVKVTVSDVPVGTKKLYITFNKTVTGDFEITTEGFIPGTSCVTVADAVYPYRIKDTYTGDYPSTVEFIISESGITSAQAANNFVLYMPVPTTSNLQIRSSTVNKETVARNYGYSWSVPAITQIGEASTFRIWDTNSEGIFKVAPGNLLAHNKSSEDGVTFSDPDFRDKIEFSFLSGTDQLITTRGKLTPANPHFNEGSTEDPKPFPTCSTHDTYQDEFFWDDLRIIMGDAGSTISSYPYNFATNGLTINETNWSAPTREESGAINDNWWSTHGYGQRRGNKATVRGFFYASGTRVRINVAGTAYEGYALITEGEMTVPGVLYFPDGYVDQTDLITNVAHYDDNSDRYYKDKNGNNNRPDGWGNMSAINTSGMTSYLEAQLVDYDYFKKMVDLGVIFLPAAGYHVYSRSYTLVGSAGIYLSATSDGNDPEQNSYSWGLNLTGYGGCGIGGRRSHFSGSVRLVREVTVAP